MINLSTAENALKSVYLNAISDILDLKTNPFLAAIEKTSENVYGNEVRKAARVKINGGIGAGTESGDLPTVSDPSFVQFSATLKNLYGQLEISDKAIRASSRSDGAFVDLLNSETENLVDAARFNFGRMLFGDGTGLIDSGYIESPTAPKALVNEVSRFLPGMRIDIYFGDVYHNTVNITDVDYNSRYIYFAQGAGVPSSQNYTFYMQGSRDKEILGIGHLFLSTDYPLYGAQRTNVLKAVSISGGDAALEDKTIQKAIDQIEMRSGTTPNFIICSPDVRLSYINYLSSFKRNVDFMELKGGFKAMSYNGIPIVVDRFVPKGTMYLLNTNYWKLYQLCDWSWIENENGKILRQTPGKATYSATLVKYAELICDRPNAQGRITSIK